MRIDKHLTGLTGVTSDQRYFLACWFNMVHQFSLDSFRVRVMNPTTMLREVELGLSFAQAKEEEKLAILAEAELLLRSDLVLRREPFLSTTNRILAMLNGDGKKKLASGKHAEKADERLFGYFLAELQPLLRRHYITTAFALLKEILLPDNAQAGNQPDHYRDAHAITGQLLSALLDQDFSLESLYRIYAEVLVPRRPNPDYRFERKLGLASTLLTQPKQDFIVTFAVDLITNPDELPTKLGNLTISEQPPFGLADGHPKSNYLTPMPRRRFATVERVTARDLRAAGAHAYEQVGNVINLLRFEYEQAKLQIPSQFAFVKVAEADRGGRVYSLPRVVPNPTVALNGNEAANFVDSVNELLSSPYFSSEGRDRITTAFRLYRLGRDQDAIEVKLVNWWTALEYLVRGGSVGGGIGKSVEDCLAPVIGLSYVPKLLVAVRNVLTDANILMHDAAGQPIELRGLTLSRLLDLFKQPAQQTSIQAALNGEPFLQEQISWFITELAAPTSLANRLKTHEQRVRWQVGRIWRTRCDIVHNAGRHANHSLLCSNLEYYLKTALHGLLGGLRSVPTLSGPHEYFDRETDRYTRILISLTEGHDDSLRATLNS